MIRRVVLRGFRLEITALASRNYELFDQQASLHSPDVSSRDLSRLSRFQRFHSIPRTCLKTSVDGSTLFITTHTFQQSSAISRHPSVYNSHFVSVMEANSTMPAIAGCHKNASLGKERHAHAPPPFFSSLPRSAYIFSLYPVSHQRRPAILRLLTPCPPFHHDPRRFFPFPCPQSAPKTPRSTQYVLATCLPAHPSAPRAPGGCSHDGS